MGERRKMGEDEVRQRYDAGEIVAGHLRFHQKLRNVERDPRVVLTIEGTGANAAGLRDYLVVHATARVVEGGAPDLLRRLAPRFLGDGHRARTGGGGRAGSGHGPPPTC